MTCLHADYLPLAQVSCRSQQPLGQTSIAQAEGGPSLQSPCRHSASLLVRLCGWGDTSTMAPAAGVPPSRGAGGLLQEGPRPRTRSVQLRKGREAQCRKSPDRGPDRPARLLRRGWGPPGAGPALAGDLDQTSCSADSNRRLPADGVGTGSVGQYAPGPQGALGAFLAPASEGGGLGCVLCPGRACPPTLQEPGHGIRQSDTVTTPHDGWPSLS